MAVEIGRGRFSHEIPYHPARHCKTVLMGAKDTIQLMKIDISQLICYQFFMERFVPTIFPVKIIPASPAEIERQLSVVVAGLPRPGRSEEGSPQSHRILARADSARLWGLSLYGWKVPADIDPVTGDDPGHVVARRRDIDREMLQVLHDVGMVFTERRNHQGLTALDLATAIANEKIAAAHRVGRRYEDDKHRLLVWRIEDQLVAGVPTAQEVEPSSALAAIVRRRTPRTDHRQMGLF